MTGAYQPIQFYRCDHCGKLLRKPPTPVKDDNGTVWNLGPVCARNNATFFASSTDEESDE